MNKLNLYATLLSFCVIFSCADKQIKNSEKKEVRWLKGNLHTHSYWSDGDEFPEVIMDWYKSNDYQFIALSDHNILAKGDKWITLREDSIYQTAFTNYLKEYGSDWVSYKLDSGRTLVKLKTYEEYKVKFEEDGEFLIIQSEEISDNFQGKPLHLVGTNLENLIEPQGGNSVADVLQNNIDAVLKQREETDIPMIAHINHPNFYYAIGLNDLIALDNERFFEVYNGHPMVQNMGDSTHLSTEEMWDQINISYLKNNKKIMYGLATDDSHNYHRIGGKWSNAGRGWIMVRSDSLSAASLIESMEKGSFYSSTGVTLKSIEFKDNKLEVEVEQEAGVQYTISFIGAKKGEDVSNIFTTVKGFKASFKLSDEHLFIRCKIVSSKQHNNPIEELLFEMAWTQPVSPVE